MSLLLDALKEAEARRGVGDAQSTGVRPAADTSATLALVEEPTATDPPRAARGGDSSARPTDSPATPPVHVIRAARSARADSASRRAPGAGRRGTLLWLMGVGGFSALLLGSFALYEAFSNRGAVELMTEESLIPQPRVPIPSSGAQRVAPSVPPAGERTAGTAGPETAASIEPRSRAEPRRRARTSEQGVPAVAGSPSRADTAASVQISRQTSPLADAWSALQRGDFALAESLYQNVLDAEPDQVDAQLALAVLAHARGDDVTARARYRHVLEAVPDHPRAWAGLAELAGAAESDQIESRLRQMLADRADASLRFALGNLLARQQRWPEAQLEYFEAASLEPRAADYAFNVAVALDHVGKRPAAVAWYRRALELAAQDRMARFDTMATRSRLAALESADP